MKKQIERIVPILLLIAVLAGAGGCTKKMRAKRTLAAANRDFQAEKYQNAELEYRKVLMLSRMNPTAIGQLGLIYLKEGRGREAGGFLAEAVRQQPNNMEYQLGLGQVEFAFHQLTNSAQTALRVLAAGVTNENALFLLVDSVPSASGLRQVMANIPNIQENHGYHVAQGMIALRERQLAQAEAEFRQALTADPKCSVAYLALAQVYGMQKNAAAAAESLKLASEAAPLRSTVRIKYCEYLIETGHREEARQILLDMSDKAPDFIPGWMALMTLAMNERNYDDAGKYADNILGREDRNYEALLHRGMIYLAKDDPAKATAMFERTESYYPRSPEVKLELANAYLAQQDKIKAQESLNQSLALEPYYPPAVMLLAQLEIRNGHPDAAIAQLKKFIQKVPGYPRAQLLLAEGYLAAGNGDGAISVYQKLATAMPKDPEFPLFAGMVLADEGRKSDARAEFEKSMQLAPTNLPAVAQLINLDLGEHNFKSAHALAQAQVERDPRNAGGWELHAKVEDAEGNSANAESDLAKAIDLNPGSSSPYLLLANIYVHANKTDEALKKLNDLVSQTNNPAAYLQIGAILEQKKDYKGAAEAFEKVLAANPNMILAVNELAYLYSARLHQLDKAYDLAQKARQLSPFDPAIADTLGWVLYQKGDYSRALAALEEAAEKNPTDPEIQLHLGLTHYMMGEEEPARVSLRRAAAAPQDFPDKAEAQHRLAILDMREDAGPAALADLEKALQGNPNDPVILRRLGGLQEAAGQYDKAAATYEKALKENPNAVHIMARLARLDGTRLKEPEKAKTLADAAHKLAPDDPEVAGVLGAIVFRTGDYTWALSLLENAADRLPNDAQAQHDVAWAYYSLGRIADAQTAMQKALQLAPNSPDSEDARQFLSLTDAYGSAAKFQAATALARSLLQKDEKYVPALMVVGAAEEQAGNFKAAQDDYNKAIDVFPVFTAAMRQLALLDAKQFPDDSKGLAMAEKAHSAYPDDPDVARSLGILAFSQGKYPRSMEVLQDLVGKNENDAEAYYYLGLDYSQLKRAKDSRQALDHALKLKLPEKLAANARQTLAQLK